MYFNAIGTNIIPHIFYLLFFNLRIIVIQFYLPSRDNGGQRQ